MTDGRTTPTPPEHATLAYDHWQDGRIRRALTLSWPALVLAVVALLAAGAALAVGLSRPQPPALTRLECPALPPWPQCPAAPTCPTCPACPGAMERRR